MAEASEAKPVTSERQSPRNRVLKIFGSIIKPEIAHSPIQSQPHQPEQEEPKAKELETPNREVRLGEEFNPFDSEHNVKRNRHILIGWTDADDGDREIYGDELSSSISLEIEGLPQQIPLKLDTKFCSHKAIDTITPYHPENGYMIGNDDLDVDKREQKVKKVLEEVDTRSIDTRLDPFGLFIESDQLDPKDFGFTPENMGVFIQFLKNLRLQITLPGTQDKAPGEEEYKPSFALESSPEIIVLYEDQSGIFKGRFLEQRDDWPYQDWDQNGKVQIRYNKFYPQDLGPLPLRKVWEDDDSYEVARKKLSRHEDAHANIFIKRDFSLALPNDAEMFNEMEARFVLVSDKKEEKAEESPEPTQPVDYIPPLGVKSKK